METHVRQVGEVVVSQFPIFDEDGVSYLSGVLPSSFDISQFRNDAEVAVTATVSEIGTSGIYQVTFTPTDSAQWAIVVKLPSTGDVWGMHVTSFVEDFNGVSEAQMNAAYDEDTSILFLEMWLDRNGETVFTGLVSASVEVYDDLENLLFSGSSSSPKVDGRFSVSSVVSLVENRPHNAVVSITDSLGTVVTGQAFTTVG